jgi:hypothetical protein
LDDRDVKAEAVSYEELLATISGTKTLGIIVLDACRVNPFRDRMHRTFATRAATDRGLAPPPEPRSGTLVAFSAKDGSVAADDVGGANSPFAQAFIREMKVPGREVRRMFDYVRDDVLDITNQRQQPFTYSSLRLEVDVLACGTGTGDAQSDPRDRERERPSSTFLSRARIDSPCTLRAVSIRPDEPKISLPNLVTDEHAGLLFAAIRLNEGAATKPDRRPSR